MNGVNINSHINKENNDKNLFKLVYKVSDVIDIVEKILFKQDIIAIDCEGVNLGKDGRLTLLQIAIKTGEVFIFDILKGGSLIFLGLNNTDKRGIRFILENKSILKVIHDCRSDWESLLHQYEIRLFNFIDSQEAYFIYKLFYNKELINPISLSNFLAELEGTKLNYKTEMKNIMFENPDYWGQRPLDEIQLKYAAEDVLYLINSWQKIENILNENLVEMSYFISILKVVNKELFVEFKNYLAPAVIQMFDYSTHLNKKEIDIINNVASYDYVDNYFQVKSNVNKTDSFIQMGLTFKNTQRENYEKFLSQYLNYKK